MTISQELKEIYSSVKSDVVLHTLELNHPTFTAPLYLVRDFSDFQANLENSGPLVTFMRYAFSITPPKIDDNGNSSLSVTIDNVGRDITELLENAQDGSQVPITVVYRIYIESDTTGPQNDPPISFVLSSVSVTNFNVTGIASTVNIANRKFPNILYGAVFQSLFIQ